MTPQKIIEQLNAIDRPSLVQLPDKTKARDFIDNLFQFLFTYQRDPFDAEQKLSQIKMEFFELLAIILPQERIEIVYEHLITKLPALYLTLLQDAESILAFDPAAKSKAEVILVYPGFYSIAIHRIAHVLHELKVPIVPRLFAEHAHSKTGIDIHPGAQIGNSFAIDHGTGVVIGETAVIGNSVSIYQGVTLGAVNVSKDDANKKRHPTIEDHVTIYSGATILGGDTVIGHHTIIGGNVFLTHSVPSYSVVYHKSEIKVRDNKPFAAPIDFSI